MVTVCLPLTNLVCIALDQAFTGWMFQLLVCTSHWNMLWQLQIFSSRTAFAVISACAHTHQNRRVNFCTSCMITWAREVFFWGNKSRKLLHRSRTVSSICIYHHNSERKGECQELVWLICWYLSCRNNKVKLWPKLKGSRLNTCTLRARCGDLVQIAVVWNGNLPKQKTVAYDQCLFSCAHCLFLLRSGIFSFSHARETLNHLKSTLSFSHIFLLKWNASQFVWFGGLSSMCIYNVLQ